jgi:hypothetical protein
VGVTLTGGATGAGAGVVAGFCAGAFGAGWLGAFRTVGAGADCGAGPFDWAGAGAGAGENETGCACTRAADVREGLDTATWARRARFRTARVWVRTADIGARAASANRFASTVACVSTAASVTTAASD